MIDKLICLVTLAMLFGVVGKHLIHAVAHPLKAHEKVSDGTPNIGVVGSAVGPSFTIGGRTDFAFIASDGDAITYRPMEFLFNGESVAGVITRGGDLVYTVGEKEVDRKTFYDFMDAWLRKSAGIWKQPTR